MQLKNSLEKIGLNTTEIGVYLFLLSKGSSKAAQIRKETNLDKSAMYKAISNLIKMKLVIVTGDARNQIFKVSTKESVLELFDKQKKEIDSSKDLFISTFADIEKYSAEHYQNENVKVFTGKDAIERYHKELIRGEVREILEIASSDTAHTVAGNKSTLDKTMSWFIPERVKRKIVIKVMYDQSSIPDEYDVSNPNLYKECRRFPGELNLTSMMTIFGDRIGFTTIKDGKYWALVINDQFIADLMRSIYNVLWNQSVTVHK